MGFEKEYKQKLTTAEEAVKVVKSGDWVDYNWCVATPVALDAAMAKRMPELTNVNFRGGVLLWVPEIFKIEEPAKHLTWNSWHMSGIERKAMRQKFAYYAPIRYSELPRYYRDLDCPSKVAMFQVAPMDEHGYFNFGPAASHNFAICERAETIIVEVNQNMPRCLGGFEEGIHISKVDMIVEGSNPPIAEMGGAAAPSEIDQAVAKMIVEEIPNGACLQLGIGGMPNAVGKMIADSDLKDLGVNTEMYVDAFVDLSLAGKINGSKKNIDRFRQTYGFAAGTKKLYDFLNNNPECMSVPTSYTNDIRTISSLDNFMSINNAVEISLTGQVSSESSGLRHISGAGGQLDFVLGAYLSNGGKSFICISSTFKDKDGNLKSRIVPTLARGTVVTDTRTTAHFIVTEYGKVNLKGLSVWQRAEALISIANPIFHDELIKDAEKIGLWNKLNK